MEIYSHNYSVILDDMDLNGYRLKPISAIMYLQDAFARMCATKHLAAYDLFPKNLYWVIAELNMEFTSQLPFWSQEVKVDIWISELTALKIYTDFRLYLGNTLLAKGNGLWFILDQITHRLVKTDIVAASFETHKELVSGEHKRFSMEKPLDTFSSIEHTMNLSDIDFNGHVNNKSYITVADASMPLDFKKNHTLAKLYISFKQESFMGDTLSCSTYRTQSPDTYVHKLTRGNDTVCDIQSCWKKKNGKEETILEWSYNN